MIYRAFCYRIYPNANQVKQLGIQFGHSRFVYNWGLALRKAYYTEHSKGIGFDELKPRMTALKHSEGFTFLQEAHSQVLQAKISESRNAFDSGLQVMSIKSDVKPVIDEGNVRGCRDKPSALFPLC